MSILRFSYKDWLSALHVPTLCLCLSVFLKLPWDTYGAFSFHSLAGNWVVWNTY